MADLQLRIMGEDNASAAFSGVSQAARAAGGILVDFYKDSLRAFQESDKAQRQLAVVAKDLTGAFQQQAQAIAETANISDELVMGVQTMLLRYGEAPAAVEATTKAVLDYAAATGTDAQTATEALTRGVEAGTGHFKGLGISIEATGDRTKDLALATAELAKKYGGASAADAASLSGSLRGASDAFGELEEKFGGFLATLGEKTGGIATVTAALREMGKAADFATKFYEKGGLDELKKMAGAFFGGSSEDVAASKQSMMQLIEDTDAETLSESAINRQKIQRAKAGDRPGRVSRGAGVAAADAIIDSPGYKMRERDFIDPTDAADADFNKAILGSTDYVKGLNQRRLAVEEGEANLWKVVGEAADKGAAEAKAKAKQWADAGASIGNAFAGSLSSAIEQLAAGGQLDVGQTVGDLLGSLLPALGGILGNLIAPGVGGALGGLLGQLGGSAARGLGRSGGGVTVQTFDSQSAREFFEGNGGRAFYNATRTGRGALGNG